MNKKILLEKDYSTFIIETFKLPSIDIENYLRNVINEHIADNPEIFTRLKRMIDIFLNKLFYSQPQPPVNDYDINKISVPLLLYFGVDGHVNIAYFEKLKTCIDLINSELQFNSAKKEFIDLIIENTTLPNIPLPGTTEPEPIEKPEPIENFVTKLFLKLKIDSDLVPDFIKVLNKEAIDKLIKWPYKTTILINVFTCFQYDNVEKTITDNFEIKTKISSLKTQISRISTGEIDIKSTKEYEIFNSFYPYFQQTNDKTLNLKLIKK